MERLTNKDAYYEMEFCEHCPYNGEPNGCNRADGECEGYFKFTDFADRLTKLEDKLESGQLVELTGKPLTIEELKALPVGDWVWLIDLERNKKVYATKLQSKNPETRVCLDYVEDWHLYFYSKYDTEWLAYKNKEQAEARLKELQGK